MVVQSKDGKEIEYKLFNFQSGQAFTIDKKDVLYLQTKDGRTERIDEPVQAPAQSLSPPSSPVSPPSSSDNRDLSQALNKLNSAIDNLAKNQGGNKPLNDVLLQLNQNIVQLRESAEKASVTSEQQNNEVIAKLSSLNKSIEKLQEVNSSNSRSEITLRKFGLGISYATNLLIGAFSDQSKGEATAFKGLYGGAGFNLVISTRMDKKVGFRYEPEFSVASTFVSSSSTIRSSFFSLGSRFFAVARRNRVNIYAGPSIIFFGIVNSEGGIGCESVGGGGFGLHFGGEYLITFHFSLNLESGMQLYGTFPQRGDSQGVFSTYGRVGGRFYF